jgi:hypothetical protein
MLNTQHNMIVNTSNTQEVTKTFISPGSNKLTQIVNTTLLANSPFSSVGYPMILVIPSCCFLPPQNHGIIALIGDLK